MRTIFALYQISITIFTFSLIISISEIDYISPIFIFSVVSLAVLIRWLIGFKYQSINPKKKVDDKKITAPFKFNKLFFSFLILFLSFIFVLYYKLGEIASYFWLEQICLLLIGIWLISGFITKKFYQISYNNIYYQIAPIIKSNILFLLFSSGVFYFLHLEYLSRQLIFGTVLLFSLLEIIYVLFSFRRGSAKNKIFEISKNPDQKKLFFKNELRKSSSINLLTSLLKPMNNKRLLDYITNFIKENNIKLEGDDLTIIATSQSVNFNYTLRKYQNLIINLNKVNDFKYLNDMFMVMKNCLVPGGYYIGVFSPQEEDYKVIRNKMPKFLFMLVYPVHFIFYRIFPKIPIISDIYDFLTQGFGRFLSKAEVFGRLAYCGYDVCSTFMIDHRIYFIARSVKTKSKKNNPSLGPIVKFDRVGYNNEIIEIFKFRTMHPYSEFIQENIFEKHKLDNDGKFYNDFRITSWGKVLRKLWIDEIPQIYNWLKGDITLVGVRALSKHYFSLYPKKIQELRIKIKPGLVPPYYADMPNNFNEIIESEKIYINKKLKNRLKTDLKYFFQAFTNIVFKGARSR